MVKFLPKKWVFITILKYIVKFSSLNSRKKYPFSNIEIFRGIFKNFYKFLKAIRKLIGGDNVPLPCNMVLNCQLVLRVILSIQP